MKLLTAATTISLLHLVTLEAALAGAPEIELGDAWSLGVEGQFRPRGTTHTGLGFSNADGKGRHHIDQRTRIGARIAHTSGLLFRAVVQDVRTWGEEDDTLNDFSANGLDMHEAYVTIPLGGGLSLKPGRQEINLDNQRLVGAVGWSQRGRSFDAARLDFHGGAFEALAFYARVWEGDASGGGHTADGDGNVPAGRDDDLDFMGLHLHYGFGPWLGVSLSYLALAAYGPNDHRQTVGLYADGAAAGLGYSAELYYQFGELGGESISASMAALGVGYTLEVATRPFVRAWGELLSGDGTATGAFAPLFPTNHKFYGEMDRFLAIPKDTAMLGLIDVGGRLGLAPLEGVSLHADLHHLRSVEPDGADESVFGTEVDVKLVVQVLTSVSLRALYGVFLPGEAIRGPRPGPAADSELENEHLFYLTVDAKI